jgi:uncharacterized Fe-S cluster protein YjdI/CDGSH-type Zn-finger protein
MTDDPMNTAEATGDSGREESNAGSGGAGAPPDEHEANRIFTDLTREYSSSGIRVQWYASRCIHTGACIRALPRVFNPRRRPWVDVDAADADAIANAVLKCPTGALHFVRADGIPEPTPERVTVTTVRDGPYFVRGEVEVTDAEGRVVRKDSRVALCRCGKSRHPPFCDNTHRELGLRIDSGES